MQKIDSLASEWLLLLLLDQFAYLLFLFTFSLLSNAAVVFTVASLYAAKPVSFSCSLTAVFPRLFRTFLWVALLMLLYSLAFPRPRRPSARVKTRPPCSSFSSSPSSSLLSSLSTSTSPPFSPSPVHSPSLSPSATSPRWPRAATSSVAAPAWPLP